MLLKKNTRNQMAKDISIIVEAGLYYDMCDKQIRDDYIS